MREAVKSVLTRVIEQPYRQRGQMLVFFALAFTIVAGGLGMAADMGLWAVERQRLQTAVDAASVAGARYLVAYFGDAAALSYADIEAKEYLGEYGFTTSNLAALSITRPAGTTKQLRISATYTRPSILLRLIGVPTLSTTALGIGDGEIKADIYVALDVTNSMTCCDPGDDINNSKTAIKNFVDMLDLDSTNPNTPQMAIGRFVGERCRRNQSYLNGHLATANGGTYNGSGWGTGYNSPNPTSASQAPNAPWSTYQNNYHAIGNWVGTTGGWCDPTQPPPLYTGTSYALGTLPSCSSITPTEAPPCDGSRYPIPFYPGAQTRQSLSAAPTTVKNAVDAIRTDTSADGLRMDQWQNDCSVPLAGSNANDWGPYRGSSNSTPCDLAGTSHTAGLVLSAIELNTNARYNTPGFESFRRVLILQTDGVVCNYQTAFNKTQSENRALALANSMKTSPDTLRGIEIFVIMFWQTGNQTCMNSEVNDNTGSAYPNCPNATTIAAAGTMTATDTYLAKISSSPVDGSGNLVNCDHYFPWNQANGSTLSNAYREILKRIAVGKLVS